MIGSYLEQYTYEYLLEQALSNVPDTIDKREGSIIYDALAPACYSLSEYYMQLRQLLQDTFAETASGQYLDLRVAEQGISRYAATKAVRRGVFTNMSDAPIAIPMGSRFSTINDAESINFIVTDVYKDGGGQVVAGSYLLTSEVDGSVGNSYGGSILPINNIPNLKTATLSTVVVPARDAETDEELRVRYFTKITEKAFGGNVAQYDSMIKSIAGVGEVQIYPVWNGGGTVKLSVIDSQYNKLSSEFLLTLKNLIDPPANAGGGLGLAPIGHSVTVATPAEVVINIVAHVELANGYNIAQIRPLITAALENYLLDLRKSWGVPSELNQYSTTIYYSRIIAVILGVPGVANADNITINGLAENVYLTESANLQELPILGVVTVNE